MPWPSSAASRRNEAPEALGATAAIGTIEDTDFLVTTFTGADAVYCMLPPFNYFDPALDVLAAARKLASNYAAAIRQAGVKRVVHLSSIGAHLAEGNGVLRFHHLAETILRELPADVSLTHVRPVSFYTNLFDFKGMVKGQGLIAANYGADDKTGWVSPRDIAAAVAEELTSPFRGRNARYVASEELTCQQIARTLGQAIGKPDLQWALISDQQMQSGLEMFGIPKARAAGIVEMNAAIHSGLLDEDYHRHRPVLGKVKLAEFAPEFAAVYQQQ